MKITNPTDTKIAIQFRGTKYSVDALDTIEVPKEVADFWKGTHGFLVVSDEVSDKVSTKVFDRISDTKIEVKPIEVKVTEEEIDKALDDIVKTTIKKSMDKFKTK